MTELATSSTDISQKRILVVDDSRTVLAVIKSGLKSEGFQNIDVAMDGREAMGKLSSSQYDVVLSDIQMPNMGGLELLKTMKADDNLKSIPVVMMTGTVEEVDRAQVFANGAVDLIGKPLPPTQLAAQLRQAMSNTDQTQPEATRRNFVASSATSTPAP